MPTPYDSYPFRLFRAGIPVAAFTRLSKFGEQGHRFERGISLDPEFVRWASLVPPQPQDFELEMLDLQGKVALTESFGQQLPDEFRSLPGVDPNNPAVAIELLVLIPDDRVATPAHGLAAISQALFQHLATDGIEVALLEVHPSPVARVSAPKAATFDLTYAIFAQESGAKGEDAMSHALVRLSESPALNVSQQVLSVVPISIPLAEAIQLAQALGRTLRPIGLYRIANVSLA